MASGKINIGTRIVRKPDSLSSSIDDELVILNVDKGEYNGLDSIGSEIWNLIESPLVLSDLISILIEKYNVSQQQCERDVIGFISELDEAGLILIENELK